MKSYGISENIETTYLDAFQRDPILDLNSKSPFIISVVIESSQEEKEYRK